MLHTNAQWRHLKFEKIIWFGQIQIILLNWPIKRAGSGSFKLHPGCPDSQPQPLESLRKIWPLFKRPAVMTLASMQVKKENGYSTSFWPFEVAFNHSIL